MKTNHTKILLLLITLLFNERFPVLAQQTNSGLPTPKRFQGVRLGMSMKELLAIRTNVISLWRQTAQGKVDLTLTNQTLNEVYSGNDPVWGKLGTTNGPVSCAGGFYRFKDGKLESWTFTWVGQIEYIERYQQQFLSSCIQLWGNDFERSAMRYLPDSDAKQLAPVLLWRKDDAVVALVCDLKEELRGVALSGFSLNVFHKRDRDLYSVYEQDRFTVREIERLFKKIGIEPKAL